MIKSIVLCMVALTVGCAARHQTTPASATTAFAKVAIEERPTSAIKDVLNIKIMSADMKVVYEETFEQPTTVTRGVCPRNPATGATLKTEDCLMWSNSAGDQFVTGLRSAWIVAYMTAYSTDAPE